MDRGRVEGDTTPNKPMIKDNSPVDTQSQSIYADQEAEGKRIQVISQDDYTPFLFDADKAVRDAGIRPLQIDDM